MTKVTLHTNYGPIVIELDLKNTPKTAENFLQYAKTGFYDNTLFHRVIDGFVVQAGGYEPGMQYKAPNEPIENEADRAMPNNRGTVAMARTSDPHSATSQFFINLSDNNFLNHVSVGPEGFGYCVFGKVISGMNYIDEIKKVETTTKAGHKDVPLDDVVIKKTEIEE